MGFIVYDHGYRIKTPVETLFPPRGVEQLSASSHSSALQGSDKPQVNPRDVRFSLPEWEEQKKRSRAAQAYSDTNEQAPPTDEPPALLASQIMSHPVHTIGPGATVVRTWQRMQSLNIHYMVVVEEKDERPLGVISDRDLLRHGIESFEPIEQLYSRKLIAARPETDVRQVAVTFIEREISCMPIVSDEDKVVGIICRTDLMRLLITGPNMERWA
ncbi:MAG: CBS domain-containing protein [Marinobacterium sp.]|nr:CBS domain-containing protein [Marinobacterium sp.]